MRIYIPALDISKLNMDLIDKYYLKTLEEHLIFSNEGIFQISDDKILRISITDSIVEKHEIELLELELDGDGHDKVKKIELVVDNSYWNVGTDLFWQVPAIHSSYILFKHFYRLRAGAGLDLVVEERNQKITDFYFVINVPKAKINKNDKDIFNDIIKNKKGNEERISINSGAADDIISFICELKYIDVL